jgi:hypothetical protein
MHLLCSDLPKSLWLRLADSKESGIFSEKNKEKMETRTDWGNLLSSSDTEVK